MFRRVAAVAMALSFLAAAPGFESKPWLEDLDQTKSALLSKYANLEWVVFEREADLPNLFADTKARIERAASEVEAREAFDRLARKLGDEHVLFEWPAAPSSPNTRLPAEPANPCMNYNARYRAPPLAANMWGYRALKTPQSQSFPAGLITVAGTDVGVIKIGVFMPRGYPEICQALVAARPNSPARICDDTCQDKVAEDVTNKMTRDLADQIRALRSAGATVLLVDIAGNGGGTEWAEAVARMLTPIRLTSAPVYFVRGPHWSKQFAEYEDDLRHFARQAVGQDRKMLLDLANQAGEKKKVADAPCDSSAFWRGERPRCQWLGRGFYASGLLASADPATLKGKPWAKVLFSPLQVPYEQGLWRGPLLVLVDRDVSSAAAQVSALLQDNKAAIIFGEPTGGGCGHTDGGTPTTLTNSRAKLIVPDCTRLRVDGSNEVMGVTPDVAVGFGAVDGPHRKAARVLAKLPEAITQAQALSRR